MIALRKDRLQRELQHGKKPSDAQFVICWNKVRLCCCWGLWECCHLTWCALILSQPHCTHLWCSWRQWRWAHPWVPVLLWADTLPSFSVIYHFTTVLMSNLPAVSTGNPEDFCIFNKVKYLQTLLVLPKVQDADGFCCVGSPKGFLLLYFSCKPGITIVDDISFLSNSFTFPTVFSVRFQKCGKPGMWKHPSCAPGVLWVPLHRAPPRWVQLAAAGGLCSCPAFAS